MRALHAVKSVDEFDLAPSDRRRLQEFIRHVDAEIRHMIGYPMAVDFDYRELYPLFAHELNNVGDPYVEPTHISHSKWMEREVIDFYADLFHAPVDDRWGYVTSGGTEGNLYGLYLARQLHPDAVVYFSTAAHYSVEKAARILRMPAVPVAADEEGEIDYGDLYDSIDRHRPAVVVATIGTTMTEAKDNVARIRQVLGTTPARRGYVHSDAAFLGIYTALIEPEHPFDFASGADSISISGHKFIGSPIPCGIVIAKRKSQNWAGGMVEYTGAPDTTISGSRGGHAAVMMWYAMKRWGIDGFRLRAKESLALAQYAEQRLRAIGWPVRRGRLALTILIATPPPKVCKQWQLATENGWSHVICSPGMSQTQVDQFVHDLEEAP
jgi:histidine decarboxylase